MEDYEIKCDKCGKIEDLRNGRTFYSGPHNDYCEECVPRNICSCNSFSTKEEALEYENEEHIKFQDGVWVIIDDKGLLIPCADWI